MELKLYRIDYEPVWPVGGGFAYVLAVDETEAKLGWLSDSRTPPRGEERFKKIAEISNDEFYNRSVLVNENGEY